MATTRTRIPNADHWPTWIVRLLENADGYDSFQAECGALRDDAIEQVRKHVKAGDLAGAQYHEARVAVVDELLGRIRVCEQEGRQYGEDRRRREEG